MTDELLSFETTSSRAHVAAMLHTIADEFDDDETFQVTFEDHSVSLALAESFSFELEIERESSEKDQDEIELEIELEWREPTVPEDDVESSSADERVHDSEPDDTSTRETETGAGEDPPQSTARESMGTFQLFEDRAGEWRWRLVHRNGNIIATSGEGYTSKQNAEKGIRSVLRNAPDADVIGQSDSTSE